MTVLQKIILALKNEKQDGDEMSILTIVQILDAYLPAEENQIRDAFEAGYKRAEFIVSIGRSCPDLETYITNLNK